MLTFVVEEGEEGLRPDRLLRERHPRIDRALGLKILKDGRILVDGETARLATRLQRGQVVLVQMSPERAGPPRAATELSLIFEAEGVVVVDKPAGLAMHAGTGVEEDERTLHGLLLRRFAVEEGFSGPSFLGRLDRPTSGLVLAMMSRAALKAVQPAFAGGRLEKGYLVVVHGKTPEEGLVYIPLAARRARHRGTGRREEAKTVFRTLAGSRRASLVLAEPKTGRTHQIRRHMKAIGHPVVGDDRYGDEARDDKLPGDATGLMLHCWRYRHRGDVPILPEALVAPVPARMRDLVAALAFDVDAALEAARRAPFGLVDADG